MEWSRRRSYGRWFAGIQGFDEISSFGMTNLIRYLRGKRVGRVGARLSTFRAASLYNHAAGVKTFVWLLTAGVDGNEYDDFGFIHGKRDLPDDFTPRPVYYAYQNTNALFADTKVDEGIVIEPSDVPPSVAGRKVSALRISE